MKIMVRENIDEVLVKLYDDVKFNRNSKVLKRIWLEDVESYEIMNGKEVEKLEGNFDCVDPYDEYLVLFYKDGERATFRNSYVDLFL